MAGVQYNIYLTLFSFLQNEDSQRCRHHGGERYVRLLRRITIVCHASAHVLFSTESGSMVTFIVIV